jgi:hypothetical protein
MDFKEATDELMDGLTYQDLAKAFGVSVSSVRQGRVKEGALCHRKPPKGWQRVAVRLAKQRAEHFKRLVSVLSDLIPDEPYPSAAAQTAGYFEIDVPRTATRKAADVSKTDQSSTSTPRD